MSIHRPFSVSLGKMINLYARHLNQLSRREFLKLGAAGLLGITRLTLSRTSTAG